MDITRLSSIPSELRKGNRFACWRAEQVREGVWITVPVDAHTGVLAASDNPATWSTFDEATAYYQVHPNTLLGVGRMLAASDVPAMLAIDFTGCLDEQGHLIHDHPAAKWLPQFDTYTEVSHSGTGVTLWTYATHDLGGQSERKSGTVAIYRERQFLPLTGQRLTKYSGSVEHCQSTLDGLYRSIFGAEDIRQCNRNEIVLRHSKPDPPLWRRQSFVPPPAPTTVSTHALPTPTPTLKIDIAKEFLQITLRNGAVEQARLIAAAKDAGIAEMTLRRAKRALRVRSTRRTYQGSVLWDRR